MLCFASLSSWLISGFCSIHHPVYFFLYFHEVALFLPIRNSIRWVYLWGLYSILPIHSPATTLWTMYYYYWTMVFNHFNFIIFWHWPKQFPFFTPGPSEASFFLFLLNSMKAEVDSLPSMPEASASKKKREKERRRKGRQSRQAQWRVVGGVGNGINNLGKSEGRTDISQIAGSHHRRHDFYHLPHFCQSATALQLPPQRL